MKLKFIQILLGCVSLMAASSASAVTIFSDGFEGDVVANGSYALFLATEKWQAGGGDGEFIEIQNNVAGIPALAGGQNFVELDSNLNSTMTTLSALSTTAGNWYRVSFLYSDRPGVGAESNGIFALVGGVRYDVAGGNGGADTAWFEESFLFKATFSDYLVFGATGDSDSLGGYIDNITVSSVPDGGATLSLLSAALGGMVFLRRFKR